MKIHFNGITQNPNEVYVYHYHSRIQGEKISVLGLFTLAGIAGSMKIVGEKGWIYLIPFWILVFSIAILMNWLINLGKSKSVLVRFESAIPHYTAADIIWMLEVHNLVTEFESSMERVGESFGNSIDIEIGKLSMKKIPKANFSAKVLDQAWGEQQKLKREWSEKTGEKYPKLNMPKRSPLRF